MLRIAFVFLRSRDGAIAVTRNLGNASTRFRFRTLNNNDFLYILEVLSTFTNVIPVSCVSFLHVLKLHPFPRCLGRHRLSRRWIHSFPSCHLSNHNWQARILTLMWECYILNILNHSGVWLYVFQTFGGLSQNCFTPSNNNVSFNNIICGQQTVCVHIVLSVILYDNWF